MVNDNRQILMSLAVADLVDPNHPQAIELALLVSVSEDRPLDNPPHGTLGDSKILLHHTEVHALS